jgi:hypothetical protein
VADAFGRAQEVIVEAARSTAAVIERAGAAARPDRVEVEFGLKFSASGGVIMAGVAGEASLKVTVSYDVPAHPAAGLSAGAVGDVEDQGEEGGMARDAWPTGPGASRWARRRTGRVPGYLGPVLDGGGAPAGTCFHVAPGVLVTAWHVLADVGAADDGDQVMVDPLGGGAGFGAVVTRTDPLRDLAVLTCEARLPGVAGLLAAADEMPLRDISIPLTCGNPTQCDVISRNRHAW